MEKNLLFLTIKQYGQLVFFLKIIICFTILFFVMRFTISAPFPYCIILQFFLGALYFHMKELQHEALHEATQWKILNRILGFILGTPMLVSYSDYQYYHKLHHIYVGTDKNTEYFTYNNQKNLRVWSLIIDLFMLKHYEKIIRKIFKCLLFNHMEIREISIRRRIKQEYIAFILIILSVILVSGFYQSLLAIKLWVIPLIFFTLPINFLLEMPEHIFCENSHKNIFHNTRTIKSNWLMTWFVNGNNYHVEHHYNPNYPISFLSHLHNEVKNQILYFDKSYASFYKNFFKKIRGCSR
mgnify:CR=1 FL=1